MTLPDPALSVQFGDTSNDAYHVTTHMGQDRVRLSSDYQRFYVPAFGYGQGWTLGFYSGVGLEGEARRDEAQDEHYHLRFPLGAQCNLKSVSLQGFTELAGLVGELPRTSLSGSFTAGLRAYF